MHMSRGKRALQRLHGQHHWTASCAGVVVGRAGGAVGPRSWRRGFYKVLDDSLCKEAVRLAAQGLLARLCGCGMARRPGLDAVIRLRRCWESAWEFAYIRSAEGLGSHWF